MVLKNPRRRYPINKDKELRKLKRRVEELEAEVEQLKKRTEKSKVLEIIELTALIFEIAASATAIIAIFLG